MPVFMILVFLGAVLLWFLLAFAFRPLGKVGNKLWSDAKSAMFDEYIEENKNETEKEN